MKVITAYNIVGGYLLKKIPINNRALQHLSAIDPQVQGCKVNLRHQKWLPKIATNALLTENQKQQYEEEVYSYNFDNKFQAMFDSERKPKKVDFWWVEVKNAKIYPNICEMVIRYCLIFLFTCWKRFQSPRKYYGRNH